jgi:CelD/BcsL family acetyltransferase involved in cellulose biosynthesis
MSSVNVSATVVSSKKTRKGKLFKLQEMPLEILFEARYAKRALQTFLTLIAQVFGYMHPYDLLRVSRTAKILRRLLVARSARATWLQAISRVPDIPSCPEEDMTELAWIRLLFDPTCHVRSLRFQ